MKHLVETSLSDALALFCAAGDERTYKTAWVGLVPLQTLLLYPDLPIATSISHSLYTSDVDQNLSVAPVFHLTHFPLSVSCLAVVDTMPCPMVGPLNDHVVMTLHCTTLLLGIVVLMLVIGYNISMKASQLELVNTSKYHKGPSCLSIPQQSL